MPELERIKEPVQKTGSGLEELLKKEFRPKGRSELDVLLTHAGAARVHKCGKNCKCFAARDAMKEAMRAKPTAPGPANLQELPKAPKKPNRKGPTDRTGVTSWEPLEIWYELEEYTTQEIVEEVMERKICACGNPRCNVMVRPLKVRREVVKKIRPVVKTRKVLRYEDGEC